MERRYWYWNMSPYPLAKTYSLWFRVDRCCWKMHGTVRNGVGRRGCREIDEPLPSGFVNQLNYTTDTVLCQVRFIALTYWGRAMLSRFCRRYFHTMDLLWEKFQWILPLYMKPISFQSKASVVCSVTTAIFIVFCLMKVNVFSQHIGKKKQMNIWIPQNKSPEIEMLINFLC